MRINSINSVYGNYSQAKSCYKNHPTFNAQLKIDSDLKNSMNGDSKLNDVMNQFKGWLSAQYPHNKELSAIKKEGKLVEQMDYSKAAVGGSPEVVYKYEDMEFSLGNARSGFCFNPQEPEERILNDLKFMFNCIRADAGY